MISAVALCCLLSGPTQKADGLTAGEVVTKMLARYAGLQTLTGQITLVVTAQAPTGKVEREYDTNVEYERPSRVYLSQVDRGTNQNWLVTSDGTIFTHGTPNNTVPSRDHRLVEQVTTYDSVKELGTGKKTVKSYSCDVTKIYAVCCTSIRDRSVPLGIAFSWNDEMRRFINQWVNPTLVAPGAAGSDNYVVTGDHRPFATNPPTPVNGKFTMVISKNFDLLEYVTTEVDGVPGHPGMTVNLSSDWRVNLTPNGQPDETLFRAVTH